MGTSISQPSPKNTNWKPLHSSYQNPYIPEQRIINEIWRASENQENPISVSLKSDSIFDCYNAVKESKTFQEAVEKINKAVALKKNNSIMAEFAKRVIPPSFQANKPPNNWAARFFCEINNYVLSRDTSGFVGEKYRNKSVKELIEFKKNIAKKVIETIQLPKKQILSKKDWNKFIDNSIKKLKTIK